MFLKTIIWKKKRDNFYVLRVSWTVYYWSIISDQIIHFKSLYHQIIRMHFLK